MDDLLQEFIAETRETLEALAGEVVAWEADPGDRARLDAIFRFVHTVKGSCGFLDLPRLARLSHAAEDVLSAVREGARQPDTALVNAVLSIIDRIGELVEAIDSGISLDDSSEDMLIAALAENAQPMAAQAAPATMQTRAHSRSVRLGVDLLDRMMSGMSDMVLARNDLARRLREGDFDPRIEAALERLSLTVADMRETVSRTRMQTIEALFAAVPRMVRDTAAELGKTVTLKVEGSDVELDREMIELMRDPLVHLIRNSIDHGIESSVERAAAGKPAAGLLSISARQSGNQILIDIADDGRGIDVDRLVAKARAQKLYGDEELQAMTAAARCELIFHPGLSSRDMVTSVSGRGVGMDIVRANIEQIGGRVLLTNSPGKGLSITIRVPLTLSILTTIIVEAGGQKFALARQSVEEIVKVRAPQVRIDRVGGSGVATVRGQRLPVVELASLLEVETEGNRADTLVIVAARDGNFALAVDGVIDTEELVIKPAAPGVMAAGVYAGQTLPDNGRPMLLLDGSGIATRAGLSFERVAEVEEENEQIIVDAERALLFEDLDGQRRVLPLATIDRVETVSGDAIRMTGGRLRVASGPSLIPIHATAPIEPQSSISLLRLTDGVGEIAYAIREAIEIVELPDRVAPSSGGGLIAGVVIIGNDQVELVDIHALFTDIDAPQSTPPVCLIHDDRSGWLTNFLKPVIEASGYRCVTQLSRGETAMVALAMTDVAVPANDGGALVRLRLGRDPVGPHDDSIYRYDRPALQAALARSRRVK
ncbi:MAG: chemotaxis protein CheW [Sphingomonas bacterium]|nr:chemotaxis protein CheW [Sphingomonas bacterium]